MAAAITNPPALTTPTAPTAPTPAPNSTAPTPTAPAPTAPTESDPTSTASTPIANTNPSLTQEPPSTVSPTASVSGRAPANTKRFRFTKETELLLLKAVSLARAHVAPWGSGVAAYEETLKIFLSSCEARVFATFRKPSAKTLKDKFQQLLSDRRAADRENRNASGVDAPYGEREALLDDLIQECDDHENEVRASRELRTSKEQALIAAGEVIRDRALQRVIQSAAKDG